MDYRVEEEPHDEGIDEEEPIPENKSSNESGYSGPTHDVDRCLILEALEEHEHWRLGPLIHEKCKNEVLTLLEEAHKRFRKPVSTSDWGTIEQEYFKTLFTGASVEVLYKTMYKLSESQDFTEVLVRHIIKSSTITVLSICFVKQQGEKALARGAKLKKGEQ